MILFSFLSGINNYFYFCPNRPVTEGERSRKRDLVTTHTGQRQRERKRDLAVNPRTMAGSLCVNSCQPTHTEKSTEKERERNPCTADLLHESLHASLAA
jgi:hypothetical protein